MELAKFRIECEGGSIIVPVSIMGDRYAIYPPDSDSNHDVMFAVKEMAIQRLNEGWGVLAQLSSLGCKDVFTLWGGKFDRKIIDEQ